MKARFTTLQILIASLFCIGPLSVVGQDLEITLKWIAGTIEQYPHYSYYNKSNLGKRKIRHRYEVNYDLSKGLLIIDEYVPSVNFDDQKNYYTIYDDLKKWATYYIPLKYLSSNFTINKDSFENSQKQGNNAYTNIYLNFWTFDKSDKIKMVRRTFKGEKYQEVDKTIETMVAGVSLGFDSDFLQAGMDERLKKALKHAIKLCGGSDEPF